MVRAFEMNPVLVVNSALSGLSKAEQKVAELVLHDPEFVMFASITDVAERAHVGETTVIRVCRKLGYRGYQEFKLALAQHSAIPQEAVGGPIETSDTLETVLRKIAQYNTQTLHDTANMLSPALVKQAADLVQGARRIYIVGVGSSGITALDLQYRLLRIGRQAYCDADSHKAAMMCALATEEDVVIGISASGSTKDVIDALTIAQKNRAAVICVTNHARSPITQLARVALLTAAREAPLEGGAVGTKIAQMHVLDALASVIALNDREFSLQAMELTAEAVVDKLL